MTPITIFAVSGVVVFSIIIAKALELHRKKPLLILKIISKGDFMVRRLYYWLVDWYVVGKEKASFFLRKQLPLRIRNLFNKILLFMKEKFEKYVGNIRNSRLLKKNDGISEFYKNISDIEKGNGEINETYEDISQNPEDKVN